jgi:hypothetical protein
VFAPTALRAAMSDGNRLQFKMTIGYLSEHACSRDAAA